MSFSRKQLDEMYMPLARQVREQHGAKYVADYMEFSFLGGMADILSLRIEEFKSIKERDKIIREFREDLLDGWEVLGKKLLLEGTVVDEALISKLPADPQQFLESMRVAQDAINAVLEKMKKE